MPKRRLIASFLPFLLVAGASNVSAQSAGTNPDISVIGQFLLCPLGEDDCAYPEADNELNLQEVEIAFQGYLNPFVRGDAFFAVHEGDFDVEELAATFVRGLGPAQARLGKYLVDWGSLNPLHPHAYSWIFRPLVEERFFGEEGLNQIGANVNLSFPAGDRGEVTLSGNLLRGDLPGGGHGDEGDTAPEAGTICVGPGCADGVCSPGDADCALVYYDPGTVDEPDTSPELAYHFRASWFDELRPSHSIQVGANGLWGTIDPVLDRKVTWLGADAKYRWRPDKYRSVNVIGAFIRNEIDTEEEEITGILCLGPDCVGSVCPVDGVCLEIEQIEHVKGGSLTTSGWYLLADWQFALQWNVGAKVDRSEGLEDTNLVQRIETFLNWRLKEESTLFRLLLRREEDDLLRSADNSVALQFVFGLGPHRPHSF